MYSGLYAPIKDPGAYLKRIGIEESTLSPDRANLDRIIYAHLTHVPFENLDEYYDKSCPELETEKLFDKIVMRNRGGYCFELNAALYSLLCALGYEAYPVACRIQWGMDHLRPLSHRATIVVIDGVKHYCDVGFGGPSAKCSVPFNETVEDVYKRQLPHTAHFLIVSVPLYTSGFPHIIHSEKCPSLT